MICFGTGCRYAYHSFVILLNSLAFSQAPDAGQPAPSNNCGKEYPRIHSDRRVTFRIKLPDAKSVAVAGRGADSGMNGNKPFFYEAKPLPHGQVKIHLYKAGTTGSFRQAYAYTPPDYDKTTRTQYPVLYLQHGSGESERGWSQQGKANLPSAIS
jgi:hypothetical protein